MASTADTTPTTPRYGEPRFTDAGLEVLTVTLHRFLAPFIVEHKLGRLRVVVGFEGSAVESAAVEVTRDGARRTEAEVDFAQLARAARNGEATLSLGGGSGTRVLAVGARAPSEGHGGEHEMAFVLVSETADLTPGHPATADLARRTAEAIRAYRFTGLRLLFDERDQVDIKTFLYSLLDRLPEWCGVDHSAALILTGELETMALNSSENANFEIVAERLFFPATNEQGERHDRLVGLVIEGSGQESGLLGYAFNRVQSENAIGLHIFVPDETGEHWHLFGEPHASARRFATRVQRPQEGMTVLVPLLNHEDGRGSELLGFLSLNYRQPTPIDPIASHLLESLAGKLARYLQRSPLFSLSARQLLLLEEVRRAFNSTIGGGGASKRLQQFIGQVNDIIVSRTSVPCFAIGHISGTGNKRQLRFVHPRGFTRFGSISIPVDAVSEEVTGTSIAALAVRLDRPVVLAGGRARDEDGEVAGEVRHVFNNDIYVNEQAGMIVDARRTDPESLDVPGSWRRLSDYYKPSRASSYATLAFPISIGLTSLGVIAVEVDRQTDWLWWTGFGSQIFYRLLANELAVAFKLMGVPNL